VPKLRLSQPLRAIQVLAIGRRVPIAPKADPPIPVMTTRRFKHDPQTFRSVAADMRTPWGMPAFQVAMENLPVSSAVARRRLLPVEAAGGGPYDEGSSQGR